MTGTFEQCLDAFDAELPFRRRGQYEFHRKTIARRRELGSVAAALADQPFLELLHATLDSWGIGRRASTLAPLSTFCRRLRERESELAALESLTIESLEVTEPPILTMIDKLISTLGVVDNRALIVAGTKTLHHLLPGLVPPMDRAWTGVFFGWSPLDLETARTPLVTEAFEGFTEVARAVHPSRFVGPGWRTSPTKVLDNALVGYCLLEGIGTVPTGRPDDLRQ